MSKVEQKCKQMRNNKGFESRHSLSARICDVAKTKNEPRGTKPKMLGHGNDGNGEGEVEPGMDEMHGQVRRKMGSEGRL